MRTPRSRCKYVRTDAPDPSRLLQFTSRRLSLSSSRAHSREPSAPRETTRVTHRVVVELILRSQLVLPTPFIARQQQCQIRSYRTGNNPCRGLLIRPFADEQPEFRTCSTDDLKDRWSIVLIGVVPAMLVSSPSRWVEWVDVRGTFFSRSLEQLIDFNFALFLQNVVGNFS